MDDAEDGGVGANAEGHDEDGYRGETGAFEQVPGGKLEILQESRHDATLPRLSEEQVDGHLATKQASSIQTVLRTGGTTAVRSGDWVSANGQDVSPNFIAKRSSREAGPSTTSGARNAPDVAQDDEVLLTAKGFSDGLASLLTQLRRTLVRVLRQKIDRIWL